MVVADTAPETTYVKKPAYPELSAKPRATLAPPSSARIAKAMPRPASVASVAGKSKKPLDPMEIARKVKAMAPMIAMMGGR